MGSSSQRRVASVKLFKALLSFVAAECMCFALPSVLLLGLSKVVFRLGWLFLVYPAVCYVLRPTQFCVRDWALAADCRATCHTRVRIGSAVCVVHYLVPIDRR